MYVCLSPETSSIWMKIFLWDSKHNPAKYIRNYNYKCKTAINMFIFVFFELHHSFAHYQYYLCWPSACLWGTLWWVWSGSSTRGSLTRAGSVSSTDSGLGTWDWGVQSMDSFWRPSVCFLSTSSADHLVC